jgi:glycosyltransferase involved in cell wall biosynthesis
LPYTREMTKPRTILFICHDAGLYGAQQSLLLLLRALGAPPYSDRYRLLVSVARPEQKTGPLLDALDQLPHVTVLRHKRLAWFKHDAFNPLQGLLYRLSLLFNLIPRSYDLFWTIRRHRIDLVHTNSVVSLEGAVGAWLAGVPHVWHIRELFTRHSPKLLPLLGVSFTQQVIHGLSQQVICISEAVREQFGPLAQANPRQYWVVYNAIDPKAGPTLTPGKSAPVGGTWNQPLPAKPAKRLRFGYVGRLSEGKRFTDVVDALFFFNQQFQHPVSPAADLIVAGTFVDAAYAETVEALIAERQMASVIHFLGYSSDLAPIYANCDAIIVPSLNEPFGRVIIEAMRAGVPCIAAASGGVPEIITHQQTGLLYPPRDIAALAQEMATLLTHPGLLTTITSNAKQMVAQRFTLQQQIQAIDACYQQIP